MPFVLIKNNLKLMLRSKWIIFIMVVFPLITIGLLSNAFQKIMKTSYEIKEFKVGYRVSEDSNYQQLMPKLKTICKKNHIVLQEYPEGDMKELLQNKTVAAFVNIKNNNSYTIYQSGDKKAEAAITESIFSAFFYQVNEAATAYSYGAEHGIKNSDLQNGNRVAHEVLDTDPVPSSTDYYGIIYIVYFTWCGLFALVAVITSEKKSAIPMKMQVAHMPGINYYLGKIIPCTLAVFIEIGTAWILSVLIFNIHWGNIGTSIFIILLVSICASAFGIVLYQIFNSVAVSIVTAFVIIWIAGFYGGSFQSYMYNIVPQRLANLSPIYYINRTLVEFSLKGYSSYTGRCIAVIVGLIIVFTAAGVLLMNRKMEKQAI